MSEVIPSQVIEVVTYPRNLSAVVLVSVSSIELDLLLMKSGYFPSIELCRISFLRMDYSCYCNTNSGKSSHLHLDLWTANFLSLNSYIYIHTIVSQIQPLYTQCLS